LTNQKGKRATILRRRKMKKKREKRVAHARIKVGEKEKSIVSVSSHLFFVSPPSPPSPLVDYVNAKYLFGILNSAHSLPRSTTGSISGMNDGWTVGWMDGEKATNRRPGDQITTTSAHISLFPLPSWPFLAIGVGKEIKKKKTSMQISHRIDPTAAPKIF
jgi:hypothetical protein